MKDHEPSPASCLAAVLATESANGGGSPTGFPYYRAARDAESLIRLGKRAARIAERQCNGIQRYDAKARMVLSSWTEADEAKAERERKRIATEARAILAPYGATLITVTGDPRGFCLKFRLASERSNSMAGEWGV